MSTRKSFGVFLLLGLIFSLLPGGTSLLASGRKKTSLPFSKWSRENAFQFLHKSKGEMREFEFRDSKKADLADSAPKAIKPPLDEYISTLQASAPYIPLVKCGTQPEIIPVTITNEQARADIDMLEYLFDHAYSGKEYWSGKGVDFPGMIAELRNHAAGSGTFPVATFEEVIPRRLAQIQDGHLGLGGLKYHRFFRHTDAFFADLLVEKQNDSFIVIDSQIAGLAAGEAIRIGKENLFPTLSPRGKEHFLVGLLSASSSAFLQIQGTNGSPFQLPLHRCRLSNYADDDTSVFSSTSLEGVPHIRVQSFSGDYNKQLEEFEKSALSLTEKPAIILNLLGNGGGSEIYGTNWLTNLNGKVASSRIGAELKSPPIVESWANENLDELPPFLQEWVKDARIQLEILKKNPQKNWSVWYSPASSEVGTYSGKLIVLMDRWVASSGEGTVGHSKAVKDLLLIGENSAGIGTFGEIRYYLLPNSQISLSLPSKIFLEPGVLEGKGFLPDLWLDTSDPLAELVRWLHDPEGYRFHLDVPSEITSIDFEQWLNGKPSGLKKSIGVSARQFGAPTSRIIRDETTFFEGKASCLLTGDPQTKNWWYLGHAFPVSKKRLSVTFAVKGDGITPLPYDYNNCHIGFIVQYQNGKYKFFTREFEGSFDWKTETVSVDLGDDVVTCEFGMMLSMGGKLWVDDIRFESSEIPPSPNR